MKDRELDESLSALMDGELPPEEAQRVLDALLREPRLQARWADWQRLSGALAGQNTGGAQTLAARVHLALEHEAQQAPPGPPAVVRAGPARRAPAPPRRRRSVFALAASVAAAAVLVAVLAGREAAPPVPLALAPAPPAPTAPLALAPAPPTPAAPARGSGPATAAGGRMAWDGTAPGVARRLNSYLLNHSDYVSDGVRGLLAYAPVVGYDGPE